MAVSKNSTGETFRQRYKRGDKTPYEAGETGATGKSTVKQKYAKGGKVKASTPKTW